MFRPLEEVSASQAARIRNRGTAGPPPPPSAMMAALQAHLDQVSAWLDRQPYIRVCKVDYHEVLREPRSQAERIERFLEVRLNTEAMAEQVDLALYRQQCHSIFTTKKRTHLEERGA